jgi:hypothetical protein
MNLSEKNQATIQKLLPSFQVGMQRRCVPTEREDKEWARLSLASAMRGMEEELGLYTLDDLKVKYTG